jgi:N-acetylglutamate synthase-like GNAT family acetyltransferase
MVIPDYTRHAQDVAPGFVRDLHETLASKHLAYRNQPDIDFDQLVRLPRMLSTQCDDGYVIGVPYGRHLRIFYEFDTINHIRLHLTNLLNEMGELASEHSEAELMVVDYSDFPHRHYVEPMFIGAGFTSPSEVSVMRCRDVRDQALPEIAPGISVREATSDDSDAIVQIEQQAAGEGAHAPPLARQFFGDADWIGIAERDGAAAGYIRTIPAEKRGITAEELLVHPEHDFTEISRALLATAMQRGSEANRRAMTLRVAGDSVGEPLLKEFNFRHITNELSYQRPADPAEVQRRRDAKVTTWVKVGKIWGRF